MLYQQIINMWLECFSVNKSNFVKKKNC